MRTFTVHTANTPFLERFSFFLGSEHIFSDVRRVVRTNWRAMYARRGSVSGKNDWGGKGTTPKFHSISVVIIVTRDSLGYGSSFLLCSDAFYLLGFCFVLFVYQDEVVLGLC